MTTRPGDPFLLDDAESARAIACLSARGRRLSRAVKATLPPLWQEVALDVDPARQDATVNAIGRDRPADADAMRRALANARAYCKQVTI